MFSEHGNLWRLTKWKIEKYHAPIIRNTYLCINSIFIEYGTYERAIRKNKIHHRLVRYDITVNDI